MQHLKIFIELTRLNKPIGFLLLFWPCAWGLAYANNINQNNSLFYNYFILFFLGSILMRSAGCIFNDIVDKDFDKKVHRTKKKTNYCWENFITEIFHLYFFSLRISFYYFDTI